MRSSRDERVSQFSLKCYVTQFNIEKYVKKLIGIGDTDIGAALQRLDRLTDDEARTTGAETLKVVYSLVENISK